MQQIIRDEAGELYLIIEFDAANQWVYNNWIGLQSYANVVTGADACLQALRRHSCPYLLNDNRLVVGSWSHATQWVVNDWVVRAISKGLTHFAHVISPDMLAARSAEVMRFGIGGRLQIRMFDNIVEAKQWLREAQQLAAQLSS